MDHYIVGYSSEFLRLQNELLIPAGKCVVSIGYSKTKIWYKESRPGTWNNTCQVPEIQ